MLQRLKDIKPYWTQNIVIKSNSMTICHDNTLYIVTSQNMNYCFTLDQVWTTVQGSHVALYLDKCGLPIISKKSTNFKKKKKDDVIESAKCDSNWDQYDTVHQLGNRSTFV